MHKWSKPSDIKNEVKKKWDNGAILRQYVKEDGLFPMSISLKRPKGNELTDNYADIIKWVTELRDNDKSKKGFGYELVEKEVNHRNVGRNTMPTHVIIPTIDDAIKMLREGSSVKIFCSNSEKLLDKWSNLEEWILKNQKDVINKIGSNCDKIISVLTWFEQNPERNIYCREISIKGVDTKFIENNQTILTTLLEIILPEAQVNFNTKIFEEKFGLKNKPLRIRFRVLDETLKYSEFSDLEVLLDEFSKLSSNFKNVFVTENEINFLSFPNVKNSCVIFGKGYGIDIFRNIEWLKDKNVYYWGDIDTHGFNILSRARGFVPNVKSFLMSEEILLAHKEFWGKEDKPFLSEIVNLDTDETELVGKLQNNVLGSGVRLEQERVQFSYVREFIEGL